MRRILHVSSTSDFVENFLLDHIEYLKQIGCEPSVACSASEEFSDLAKRNEFAFFPIRIFRSYTPISDAIAIRQLVSLLKEQCFDLVIGHTPKGALISMIAAKLAGISNRVYFRHGVLYQTSNGYKRFFLKFIEIITGRFATQVINASQSVFDFAVENNLNHFKKNILLGRRGSCGAFNDSKFQKSLINDEVEEVCFQRDDVVIGFVGRLVNDKGVVDLLKAWEIISRKNSHLKLLIVGDYEERDDIDDNFKKFIKTTTSIIHLNHVKVIAPIYNLMDIFVLPSYREGLPTVVLEASSMQIPIITTRVTGCVDAIIEFKTGLFCTHEPEDIAEKMTYYINNPELRKLHGENGRKFVLENFKQQEIFEDFRKKVLDV